MWATYRIKKLSFKRHLYIERHWNRSWTFARRSVFILYSSRMKRKLWTKKWITWRRIILNIRSSTTYIQYYLLSHTSYFRSFYICPWEIGSGLRLSISAFIDLCFAAAHLLTDIRDIREWLYVDALRRLGSFAMGYMRKHTGNRIGPNCPHRHRPLWRIVSCTDAQP